MLAFKIYYWFHPNTAFNESMKYIKIALFTEMSACGYFTASLQVQFCRAVRLLSQQNSTHR